MGFLVGGHSDAMSKEDFLASGDQAWFRLACVRSEREFRCAFFIAVTVELSVSGEISDLAFGGVISRSMGIPDVCYWFVGFYTIDSELWCAEGAGVSDLFTFVWADANLPFYLGGSTAKKAVGKVPACKAMKFT